MNWFSAEDLVKVERGIDDNLIPSSLLKGMYKMIVTWIIFAGNRLNASRLIYMGHTGDISPLKYLVHQNSV
jgi:hypothetical protein